MSDELPQDPALLDLQQELPEGCPLELIEGCFTREEIEILASMRTLKKEAAALKSKLQDDLQEEHRREAEQEMKKKREQWQELSEQRSAARHRRMVLLGHEKP